MTTSIGLRGDAMKGDRERFIAAGMDDCISKPVKRKTLQDVLSRVMDKK